MTNISLGCGQWAYQFSTYANAYTTKWSTAKEDAFALAMPSSSYPFFFFFSAHTKPSPPPFSPAPSLSPEMVPSSVHGGCRCSPASFPKVGHFSRKRWLWKDLRRRPRRPGTAAAFIPQKNWFFAWFASIRAGGCLRFWCCSRTVCWLLLIYVKFVFEDLEFDLIWWWKADCELVFNKNCTIEM